MDRYSKMFNDCARVIATGFTKAEGYVLTSAERARVESGKGAAFDMITVLCNRRPSKQQERIVERVNVALREVHHSTDYTLRGTMIRDLGELVITLERLEQGRRRIDQKKYVEASMLCQTLSEQLEE